MELTARQAHPPTSATRDDAQPDFRAVYEAWFAPVCRWLRALGGPSSDVEDLAQEVFLIARRKLPGFAERRADTADLDGQDIGGWLWRIARGVAANARRRAWFRHLFRGRAPDAALAGLGHQGLIPSEELERKEAEAKLYALLDRLSEKRRTALILSEIEGLSSEEIAHLESIPVATVRTRLFHARRELVALAAAARRREER